MASLETLLSFVNTWECDENDHLNVQFYFSKFEEADRQFRMLTGFSEALVGARRVRHVRYHAELVAASLITVKSYVAFDGPHMLSVVHEMIEGSTGEICATAIDATRQTLPLQSNFVLALKTLKRTSPSQRFHVASLLARFPVSRLLMIY